MAKTFSGLITSTVTLNAGNAGYNPVTNVGTIASVGGDGIDGSDLAWTIDNARTISGGAIFYCGGVTSDRIIRRTTPCIVQC